MPEPSAHKTILVIEDSPIGMRLVTDLLQLHGFRVLQAADAASGLTLARRERPDLVLLDAQLPDMDAHELFRTLRDNPQTAQLKVIAMTASPLLEPSPADAGKFDDAIAKPINTAAFLERLRRLLGA